MKNRDSIVIKPRFWARDTIDWLIGIPLTLIVLAIMFAPAVIVWFTTYNADWSFGVMVASYLSYSALMMGMNIWTIRLDEHGIHFKRLFGYPRFLPWKRITNIRMASRAEVIKEGWLCFPHRENTSCLSSLGHYRIEWEGEFLFFPPQDTKLFDEAVATWWEE